MKDFKLCILLQTKRNNSNQSFFCFYFYDRYFFLNALLNGGLTLSTKKSNKDETLNPFKLMEINSRTENIVLYLLGSKQYLKKNPTLYICKIGTFRSTNPKNWLY